MIWPRCRVLAPSRFQYEGRTGRGRRQTCCCPAAAKPAAPAAPAAKRCAGGAGRRLAGTGEKAVIVVELAHAKRPQLRAFCILEMNSIATKPAKLALVRCLQAQTVQSSTARSHNNAREPLLRAAIAGTPSVQRLNAWQNARWFQQSPARQPSARLSAIISSVIASAWRAALARR